MEYVPTLFLERVSALLTKESLGNLKGCRSAAWQKVAKQMWTVMKKVRIEVQVPREDNPTYVIYNCATSFLRRLSVEDLRKSKHAFINMDISQRHYGPEEECSGELFIIANALHVEKLKMEYVHRFDTLFQNFFPLSVHIIKITDCIFAENSTFPEWLRRTLRSNSLQELTVEWITVEGRPEDVEEDVLHQSLMCGKSLNICLGYNKNFTNLNAPFFRRVLNFWMNCEEPFPREIRYTFSCRFPKEIEPLCLEYFKDGKSILHKSGNVKVTWESSRKQMVFTP
uniref:FBA_2 domain-containing protein n=1 Tax=Steinernema glaseri TaxID=37863 RepID=A0A1I7YU16_9BILA